MSESRTAPRQRLVLVVGVGRSGTSLLPGILGQPRLPRSRSPRCRPTTPTRAASASRAGWSTSTRASDARSAVSRVNDSRPAAWESTAERPTTPPSTTSCASGSRGELARPDERRRQGPAHRLVPRRCGAAAPTSSASRTSFVTMLRHPAEIVASARKCVRHRGRPRREPRRRLAQRDAADRARDARRAARVRPLRRPARRLGRAEIRRARHGCSTSRALARRSTARPEVDAFVDPTLHRNRAAGTSSTCRRPCATSPTRVGARAGAGRPDGTTSDQAALDDARAAYAALYARGRGDRPVARSWPRGRSGPRKRAAPAAPRRRCASGSRAAIPALPCAASACAACVGK